jgi:hypothetical protein
MRECEQNSSWCIGMGMGMVGEEHIGVRGGLCSPNVCSTCSTCRLGKTHTTSICCFTGGPTSILNTDRERQWLRMKLSTP